MILIAESGSTKTDWILLNHKGVKKQLQSAGINPFYQDTESIYKSISELKHLPKVDQIYFYGAGCANEEKNQIVRNAILRIFPEAQCEINSDLLAAARSLCGQEKGIACILGTGSNSCFYNGNDIEHNVSPLGFILGDEGSGAVLGKKLVADVLKNQAPTEIIESFYHSYNLGPTDIVHQVYREAFPNRFLAQFTIFIADNIDNEYIANLVKRSFIEFFERNIKQYPNYSNLLVHFTGSVAFYFKNELLQAAKETGISLGNLLKSPLEGLVQFHSV